mgnify:CR=1 FL=1
MTYRDQLEFRIRKLDGAIDALAELPDFSEITKFADKLKRERGRLRRTIADGRRSCGECGHPMRKVGTSTGRRYWKCETEDCATVNVRA